MKTTFTATVSLRPAGIPGEPTGVVVAIPVFRH
jgi:hypothetical protein